MNYIDQINVFWLLDTEHLFNGNESRLYFYLLKLSNSLYWKNPFTNADGYTASMVGISVNTLKTARNRLQQAGLIKFKTGGNGARDKCVYELLEASKILGKVSNPDTLSAESLTPYQHPNRQNTDDINKHKPKKTKPEQTSETNVSAPASASSSKNRKKNKEEETTDYWQALVDIWFAFNREFLKIEPSFKGSDPRDLKGIVEILKKRAVASGYEWSEKQATDTLTAFLHHSFKDTWLQQNFLLSNLLKQFDKIVTPRNGQTNNNNRQQDLTGIKSELAAELGLNTGES